MVQTVGPLYKCVAILSTFRRSIIILSGEIYQYVYLITIHSQAQYQMKVGHFDFCDNIVRKSRLIVAITEATYIIVRFN